MFRTSLAEGRLTLGLPYQIVNEYSLIAATNGKGPSLKPVSWTPVRTFWAAQETSLVLWRRRDGIVKGWDCTRLNPSRLMAAWRDSSESRFCS